MLNKKILALSSILALAPILGGCGANVSPNDYKADDVGTASRVVKGTIVAIRPIDIKKDSGAGALAGAVAGGAGASMIGGTTAVRIASGVGGAVVGGLIGNEAEKAMRSDKGYEYIIQLDNGNDISVTQQQDLQLAVNQHVLVIYGAMTRIVADNTVSVPVATPAPAATTASSNKATTKTATSASKPTSSKTAASTTTTSTKS